MIRESTQVDRSGGLNACWEWTGRRNPDGYGLFGGELAHRLAFAEVYGPIPAGLQVRHGCDNPGCCNPTHLRLGTNADNVRDRVERGRSAVGSQNGSAKLSESAAKAIRARYVRGCRANGANALAREFGVSKTTIRRVVRGENWVDASWRASDT